MRWTPGSGRNIEDMRGRSGMGMRAAPLGIGGLLVVLLLSWATGVDFMSLLGNGGGTPPTASVGTSGAVNASPEEKRLYLFVDAVMEDTQATWREILGDRYRPTTAVVFRDAIQSACGFAQSASGPFYCPGDGKVYLDLGFFDELRERFGAPGDFAQAYVLAHEMGHHVQTLLGTEGQVRQRQAAGGADRNALSVVMELQADCYAGVWGHATKRSGRAAQGAVEMESGDAEEGLRAASAIGDDRIQRMSTGRVFPDRFTHGSSEQRVRWFRRGLDSGDPRSCNTFDGM